MPLSLARQVMVLLGLALTAFGAACQTNQTIRLAAGVDLAKAKAVFERRLQANSHDLPAKVGKAAILRTEGQTEQAKQLLLEVLNEDPKIAEAHAVLGSILSDEKQYPEARKAFETALSLNNSLVDAQAGLGRLDIRDGNYEIAVQRLSKALTRLNEPYVYADRALALSQLKKIDAAETDYATAIAALPNDPFLYLDRGRMRLRAGKFGPAIADFDKVLRLSPNYTIAHMYRGQAADMLGNVKLAIADYEEVLAKRPKYQPVLEPLASLYLEAGRHRQSSKLFRQLFDPPVKNDRVLVLATAALLLSDNPAVREEGVKLAVDIQKIIDRKSIFYSIARAYADAHQEDQALLDIQKLPKGRERAHAEILIAVAFARSGSVATAKKLAQSGQDAIEYLQSAEARLASLMLHEPRKSAFTK